MKNFLSLLAALIILAASSLFSQNTIWVKSFGGINSDKFTNVGTDSLGNVYIGGYFNGSITVNGSTYTSYSGSPTDKDIFIGKMDTAGNWIWVRTGGSYYDDRIMGMHVDKAGNVYATGTFWTTATFGAFTIGGTGYDNSFLVKLNSNGDWQFAKTFGCNISGGWWWSNEFNRWIAEGDDHCYDVALDPSGNIYVTGWWSNTTATFDNITLTNPKWISDSMSVAYVAKADPSGNFLWAKQFDGVDNERDNRLAVDKNGNVFVTGGFKNTGTYGSFQLTSSGEHDVFVVKLDTDGNLKWAKRAGSNKDDRGNGIAVDNDKNVYISGEYLNPADFGSDSLKHKSKRDIFVAKLDNNGNWKWASRARSAGKDKAYQMHVNNEFYIFTTGEISDTTNFQSVEVPVDTTTEAYVAQMDSSGKWLWAKKGGSPISDDDHSNDVCTDIYGNTYVVGYFEYTANFDGHTITTNGKKDMYIWKLDKYIPPPKPPKPQDTIPAELPLGELALPTAFSPNGDGLNDVLRILGGKNVQSVELTIYNRWGEQIFYTNDIKVGWDGTYKGKMQNSGVYAFTLKVAFINGEMLNKKGNITIIK